MIQVNKQGEEPALSTKARVAWILVGMASVAIMTAAKYYHHPGWAVVVILCWGASVLVPILYQWYKLWHMSQVLFAACKRHDVQYASTADFAVWLKQHPGLSLEAAADAYIEELEVQESKPSPQG